MGEARTQSTTADLAASYQSYRPLQFSIAYRMTGSASEAEDILQEGYLRLHAAASEGSAPVESPRAYLSTVITRLALDHLKKAKAERERYDGPWLPEPLLTAPDPAEGTERRESISLAFLVLLEALSPEERATFLLHEVFDYPHDEIAPMIGKSPAACRQLLRRARVRLDERRTQQGRAAPATVRRRATRAAPTEASDQHQRLLTHFLRAVERGDVQALAETLAQDVVHVSDGGGKVHAARRPIVGRDAVLNFFAGLLRLAPPGTRFSTEVVNGLPALLVWVGEQLINVTSFEAENGVVTRSYTVANPDKLAVIARQIQERQPVAL